jgi:autotransporter-associated beta strand protein
MALRYFDRNGTSAGFGTLNGAWDTTTASWSTSSAGTATPTAFTFTNADQAQFGATGATATAGTATISTGVTVTLNGIIVQNIGTQTVARGGTGTLVLAGTTPTINCSGANIIFTTPIGGTAGFTKDGTGTCQVQTQSTIEGACTITASALILGVSLSGSAAVLPSIASYAINNTDGSGLQFYGLNATSISQPFTGPAVTGSNEAGIQVYNPGGITFLDAASCAAFRGYFYLECSNTANAQAALTLSAIPAVAGSFIFRNACNSSTARTNTVTFTGTGGTTAALIDINVTNTTAPASTGVTHALVDNSTGATSFTGGVLLRAGSVSGADNTVQLAGTNTASAMNSAIDQSTGRGRLFLSKAGSGKWALTGANTYTGTTTISAGTLSAQNASALGRDSSLSGGAISVTGGTLELSGGITLDKSGLNISTVTTASPTNAFQVPASGGDNTLEVGSITLNSTILVDVGSSAALRLANTGAISGSTFGITKEGAGELDLNAAANAYTGAVAVNAGTLTVSASCAPSTNGPLGNASSAVVVTGTLKFDGTSNSNISRSVQLTGATPALDASGTHHVHFSAVSQASGSRTLTLRGTSTATNQLQSALGNGSGGTLSLTKDGTGQWLVTGTPTYTGTTTVNAGTLDFGGQTLSLSGGVAMAGGTLANGNIGDTLVSAVTFTGGTVIALLDSTSTVTATSGTGRLQPLTADGSNSYTGTTTVQSGATLELVTDSNPGVVGDGKVTGASNVTVSGTLATGSGVNQRGQCRYGGNLTFAAGSVLAIGAAA